MAAWRTGVAGVFLRYRKTAVLGLACSYAGGVEYRARHADEGAARELPRAYDREAINAYWSERPVSVVHRLATIAYELGPRALSYFYDFHLARRADGDSDDSEGAFTDEEVRLQREHATKLRAALTRLGPAFVKIGQQLSIRPDLVSPAVLAELQKLCDAVEPVSDAVAKDVIRRELGCADLSQVFDGMELVAAASLGQVYRATIRETGERVAIKVQRPDMQTGVSLDLFLMQRYGALVDAFTTSFTEQLPYHVDFISAFAHGSYSELDYELEAQNQMRFKSEFAKRKCNVFVPSVFQKFSSRRVITSEWVDGVKLASAPKSTIRQLIPVGVDLFLSQLLDIGAFHSDPHPGNLYVAQGRLCLLDFGLVAEVDEQSRNAMTAAIVHLITGDFETLVKHDAKELGFLPRDLDTKELQPLLTKILREGLLESGSNLRNRKRKLMEISNELNEVFFRHPFSVPPFFALVTRGLGLLEGIAITGDPEFDIFKASAPYAKRRALEIFGTHALNKIRSR
eukprot:Hpha_TRINITY_DN4355_c0_g1::TRINITY_DN4355_c0_g1_i1::g.50150::m.50150/K08869/ADCK, ABC1; aarF domain-containing kinase